MHMTRSRCVVLVVWLVGTVWAALTPARAETLAWSDDFLTRLEALALVQTLNAEILASRSATLTLEKWCGEHRLAGGADAKIVARLVRGPEKPATAEQRQRLAVGPGEALKYRRVQLVCGDRVLSEADNWYVPSRLTPEMNRVLETTDTPFGRAVLDLKPFRQTFAANILWWPLARGWETQPTSSAAKGDAMTIPDAIFEHRAVLYTDGQPFSEVHEVYQRQLLAFPLPHP
jgi:chorismate-pyruvate lyase